MVGGVHYRQPGLWVKAATTLDVLSGGRAWLGIGAAWNQEESDGLGFPFPPLGERFEMLEETLRIAHDMWHGRAARRAPSTAALQATRLLNSPQSLSRPRIADHDRRRRRAEDAPARGAVRRRHNVFGGPGTIHHKYEVLRAHCEAVGAALRRDRALDAAERPPDPGRRRSARRPAQLVDRFGELADAGAQHLIFSVRDLDDPARLELLGREIMPRCGRCETGAGRVSGVSASDTRLARHAPERASMTHDDATDPTNGANPFGGFNIDFSNDIGAAPRANAAGRHRVRRRAGRGPGGPGSTARRGPHRDQADHRRLRPGRPDRRDLRGAGQPRADRHRRLGARRPADAHERRRELPGLPGRHPGPGPDGRSSAPRRSASGRRSSTSTSTASTSRSGRSASGPAAPSTAAQSVIVATGASALWLGLDSETRLRGRGVSRLRDLRRLLLPRPARSRSSAAATRPSRRRPT